MQTLMSESLNPLQIELLKQFRYGLKNEEDLLNIKRIIAKYLANKISNEMEKIWEENCYDNETLESWLKEDS